MPNLQLAISSVLGSLYGNRHGSTHGAVYILLGLAGVALLWVGIAYFDKYRKSKQSGGSQSDSLFGELCRVHHIGRGDRAVLAEAAELQNLEHREMLFVDPRIWDNILQSHGSSESEFASLKTRLFGNPAEEG